MTLLRVTGKEVISSHRRAALELERDALLGPFAIVDQTLDSALIQLDARGPHFLYRSLRVGVSGNVAVAIDGDVRVQRAAHEGEVGIPGAREAE